jgi:DNA-binding CsgD family transcriptional regulator/tetratricopeptide (TPR) repeat protein
MPSALVGRVDEMARLQAALDRAAAGQGGVLLLSAEPGVGKTRLLREAAAGARQRGFLVLEGRAYSLESQLPYGLVLDALDAHLRGLDDRGRSRLVSGSPELARLLDPGRAPPPPPDRQERSPETEGVARTQLLASVARLLLRLAGERPVLLSLDDLHWADPASLELIHFVGRQVEGARLLMLGTYRSGEDRPLLPLVRSFRRLGVLQELVLPRLGQAGTAALLQELLAGAPVPEGVVGLLQARSGGVPLFLETLVRALVESGGLLRGHRDWVLDPAAAGVLPAVIRDLMLERLDHVGDRPRRLLDLLAVAGEALPHAALLAAADLPEDELLSAVAGLSAAGLVSESTAAGGVAYTPSHPLILEVAYQALPAAARARAHLRLAQTLERLGGAAVSRLARHYLAAGAEADPVRSLSLLREAAERAYDLGAYHEAAGFFAGAVALARRQSGHELAPLLERLGESWRRSGSGAGAISVLGEALPLYQAAGDRRAAARVRRQLAAAEWDRGRLLEAAGHLDAAASLLAADEPGPDLCAVVEAQTHLYERSRDRERYARAVAAFGVLAERAGDQATRVEAILADARLRSFQSDYVGALAGVERATRAAGQPADARLAYLVAETALTILAQIGEAAPLRAAAEKVLELGRPHAAPAQSLRARGCLIIADLISGQWASADRGIDTMITLGQRYEIPRICARGAGMAAWVAVMRGDLPAAATSLEQARAILAGVADDRRALSFIDWVDALAALEDEDAVRADALAPALAAEEGELIGRRQATLGEIELLLGQVDSADRRAEVVRAMGPDLMFGTVGLWLQGRVRAARGDRAGARRLLEQAVERLAAADNPFDLARARLHLALVTDKRAGAVALAEESRTAFDALGARRHGDRARKLLRGAGAKPPPRRRLAPGGGPLSARELEVARLYAEGLTTAQVAKRLVISPHTATTHLQRIYERLGVHTRAALTRKLIEQRLL